MRVRWESGALPVVGLADLPEHRQELLLWRHALELDYDGVDDLVRENSPRPCRWESGPWPADTADQVAIRGDDGRYHLCVDGHPMCARESQSEPANQPAQHHHEQWCFWWTDGTRYRVQQPPGLPYDPAEHVTASPSPGPSRSLTRRSTRRWSGLGNAARNRSPSKEAGPRTPTWPARWAVFAPR